MVNASKLLASDTVMADGNRVVVGFRQSEDVTGANSVWYPVNFPIPAV